MRQTRGMDTRAAGQRASIPQFASVLFTIALTVSGCEINGNDYLAQRRRDLTDTAHISYGLLTAGFLVNAGPAGAGWETNTAVWNASNSFALGLGGLVEHAIDGEASGVLFPWQRASFSDARKGYDDRHPRWASIGVRFGYMVGIGFRFDLVEFIDFVTGMFGLDISGDDRSVENEESPVITDSLS